MLGENRQALKEWAVVDEALAAGEVSLLLRKGGTRERDAEFSADHPEFWIYPAGRRQRAEDVSPHLHPLLDRLPARPSGGVRFRVYCTVERVLRIEDPDVLDRLRGLHPLSTPAAHQRFRSHDLPLVHALLVRAHLLPGAVVLPEAPHYDEWPTWVELERALPTAGLVPVLSDETFAGVAAEVERRVSGEAAVAS